MQGLVKLNLHFPYDTDVEMGRMIIKTVSLDIQELTA